MSNQPTLQILLVEDDEDDVEMILNSLGELAAKTRVVRDGSSALDALLGPSAICPDVVILDLKLPKVHGKEVLRNLRSDPRTKRLPIVIFTSSDIENEIADCYDLCANSYVVKPFAIEVYSETVRQIASYWVRVNRSLSAYGVTARSPK